MNAHFVPLDPGTVAHILGGERSGSRVVAPGPGHSRKDRSLSVLVEPSAQDGFVVHSFAGDDPLKCRDYVNERLGKPAWSPTPKRTSDDILKKSPPANNANNGSAKSRKVAQYVYKLADGTPYLRVDRYEPKSFPQYHWTGSEWAKGKPPGPKVPYRLPDLRAAVHDTVFICEGEKDADALASHGFVATSASEGAGKWTSDLNPYFEGKTVYVLPDNDEAGTKHAEQVAKNLHGIVREVRIVNLPGLRAGGDVSEWLDAGGDTSKLIDIAKAAALWEPSSFERKEWRNDSRKDWRKDSPRIGSAADLKSKRFPAIRYVVPNYIAEGCTLLAGRPKLGKSWLMLDVSLAVAAGRICLGETRCEQGDTLYLALEDNERRLQRRIAKVLGTGVEWPAAFQYATEWPRANEGGLDAIREWIGEAKNPRLVVVDVLAMFKPVRGDKETLYEADYGAIKGLQALAGEFHIAIVVVHHTRKSGTEHDPLEKISGTLGFSGAADTVLVLDKDGAGSTLYGRGRDVEEIEAAVEFDRSTCRWRILGQAADVRRSDERNIILKVLKEAGEPMATRDIMVAAELTNRNAVDILLFKMAKAGEVEKNGRGVYAYPGNSSEAKPPGKNGKMERFEDDRSHVRRQGGETGAFNPGKMERFEDDVWGGADE